MNDTDVGTWDVLVKDQDGKVVGLSKAELQTREPLSYRDIDVTRKPKEPLTPEERLRAIKMHLGVY